MQVREVCPKYHVGMSTPLRGQPRDTWSVLELARQKLLLEQIAASELSTTSKVLIEAVVGDSDLSEFVEAMSRRDFEAAHDLVTGSTSEARLARGILCYETGRRDDALLQFRGCGSMPAAWVGYSVLSEGDARTLAHQRAREMDPNLCERVFLVK